MNVFLTRSEIALAVPPRLPVSQPLQRDAKIVRLRFEQSSGSGKAALQEFNWVGEGKILGETSYFIGNDPRRWQAHIPNFTQLASKIATRAGPSRASSALAIVAYGNGRDFEYDLRFSPGENPSGLRMKINGADAVSLAKNGDLEIATGGNRLVMRKPKIYEENRFRPNGQGRGDLQSPVRRQIDGGYRLEADGSVAFRVGPA